jgi:hypothetical protein
MPRTGSDGRRVYPGSLPETAGTRAVQQVKADYIGQHQQGLGLKSYVPQEPQVLDTERARQIGNDYESMPEATWNEETRRAYGQLAREVKQQYEWMTDPRHGNMTVEFTRDDPYKSSEEMIRDATENHHLRIFLTAPDSFGSKEVSQDHPLLGDSGLRQGQTPLCYNDLFRAVHDYFGHASGGNQFGPIGEERAWHSHVEMFSTEAARAMTSETRGQNSWVNFGPQMFDEHGWRGEKSHPRYLAPKDRPFGVQKVGLLPERALLASPVAPGSELFERLKTAGGFSYQPTLATSPREGFAVSAFEGAESVYKADELTEDDIVNYLLKHQEKFRDTRTHFGAWHDKESGKIYLDLSVVVGSGDEASQIAREHHQEGYYDLTAGKTVIVKSDSERRKRLAAGLDRSDPGQARGDRPGESAPLRPRTAEEAPPAAPVQLKETSQPRPIGVPWQGASGRWFMRRPSDGKIIFVAAPNQTDPAGAPGNPAETGTNTAPAGAAPNLLAPSPPKGGGGAPQGATVDPSPRPPDPGAGPAAGGTGEPGPESAEQSARKPKPRASLNLERMAGARKEGAGKNARVVLDDGTPAPEHVKPGMIGPGWTEVRVSLDPEADFVVTGHDRNGKPVSVYSDSWNMKRAAEKFARTREGLLKKDMIDQQVQRDRLDPKMRDLADCVWLMREQATRPGSETDNKGVADYFGQRIRSDDVIIQGEGKKAKVFLRIRGYGEDNLYPIRDKQTKAELLLRKEKNRPLFDSTYWLKSHGATTLEGRHVVAHGKGVWLEFVEKTIFTSTRFAALNWRRCSWRASVQRGEGELFGVTEKRVSGLFHGEVASQANSHPIGAGLGGDSIDSAG